MSEGHRFEVNSKGDVADLEKANLLEMLKPIEEEVKMIRDQGTAGTNDLTEIAVEVLKRRFSKEELLDLFESTVHIRSGATHLENGDESPTFMDGTINWRHAIVQASHA